MSKLEKTNNQELDQINGGANTELQSNYKYHIVCKSCDQSVEKCNDLNIANNVCKSMNEHPDRRCSKCHTKYNVYYVCDTRGDE